MDGNDLQGEWWGETSPARSKKKRKKKKKRKWQGDKRENRPGRQQPEEKKSRKRGGRGKATYSREETGRWGIRLQSTILWRQKKLRKDRGPKKHALTIEGRGRKRIDAKGTGKGEEVPSV